MTTATTTATGTRADVPTPPQPVSGLGRQATSVSTSERSTQFEGLTYQVKAQPKRDGRLSLVENQLRGFWDSDEDAIYDER